MSKEKYSWFENLSSESIGDSIVAFLEVSGILGEGEEVGSMSYPYSSWLRQAIEEKAKRGRGRCG